MLFQNNMKILDNKNELYFIKSGFSLAIKSANKETINKKLNIQKE